MELYTMNKAYIEFDGYCPESKLKGELAKIRLNDSDFWESEKTGLQLTIFPPYAADTVNYWPAYCKFLLYGSESGELPKNIRIFNKVGDAYGQMIDVAYIVDFDKKIEFFLSAIIYCNNDGILNDDKYDYDAIGFPFMKHLGEVFYQYELNRKKKIEPNLSSLLFDYDNKK